MVKSRRWMLVLVTLGTMGPLLASIGYGTYIRSGPYRRWIERQASAFLAAPVKIRAVQPIDFHSRGFRDIRAFLPGQAEPIFACRLAVWRYVEGRKCELQLRDGRIEVRSRGWGKQQVDTLIKTAVAHDFDEVQLVRIRLTNMDLVWRHGPLRLSAKGASGFVDLSGQVAEAAITCEKLNGIPAKEPISITARFKPGSPPLIHELVLNVPGIPVEAFLPVAALSSGAALADASQPNRPTTGLFTGRIVYAQRHPGDLQGRIEITGRLRDVDLGTLGRLAGQAGLRGVISGMLENAVLEGGKLQRLSARLFADQVDLAGLCKALGLPQASGLATIDLNEFRYEDGTIKALLAKGHVKALGLAEVLKFLKAGTITGRIDAELQSIKVIDGRLDELVGRIEAIPPPDAGGFIDRAILEAALWQFLKIPLPPVLPKRIKYSALGARLHAADDRLYILGITGPAKRFLLMAHVGGVPMPLIPQPITPIRLANLRQHAEPHLQRTKRALVAWLRDKLGN